MAFSLPPLSLPNLPYKWIGVALAALAVVAAVFFSIKAYGGARYDAGVLEERAVWEKVVADQKLLLAELQRRADAALTAQRDKSKAEIEQARKELEDAVASIPDQETSDRQRTRACIELMRSGQDAPACQHFTAP